MSRVVTLTDGRKLRVNGLAELPRELHDHIQYVYGNPPGKSGARLLSPGELGDYWSQRYSYRLPQGDWIPTTPDEQEMLDILTPAELRNPDQARQARLFRSLIQEMVKAKSTPRHLAGMYERFLGVELNETVH